MKKSIEDAKKLYEKEDIPTGFYKGPDLILASAMLMAGEGEPKIDPTKFVLLFFGGKAMKQLGKKLIEMADHEEFLLFVENPPMPDGSV